MFAAARVRGGSLIHWREFKTELPVVTLLATVGVALAAAVTALGMHYALSWDWGSALIFGVLIAATDPVSVIATLKESKVSGRLKMLIESERFLNDGTAAVAFVTVLGVLAGVHGTVLSISAALFVTIIGGVLIGGAISYILMLLAGRTPDYLVETPSLRLRRMALFWWPSTTTAPAYSLRWRRAWSSVTFAHQGRFPLLDGTP